MKLRIRLVPRQVSNSDVLEKIRWGVESQLLGTKWLSVVFAEVRNLALDQSCNSGTKRPQIVKTCRDDVVHLAVVDLPVHMNQQVSEARHLLQAAR